MLGILKLWIKSALKRSRELLMAGKIKWRNVFVSIYVATLVVCYVMYLKVAILP